MKTIRINTKVMAMLTLILGVAGNVMAGSPTPPPPPPGGAPIDAGAIILLLAGVAIGVEKLYSRHKQKTTNSLAA